MEIKMPVWNGKDEAHPLLTTAECPNRFTSWCSPGLGRTAHSSQAKGEQKDKCLLLLLCDSVTLWLLITTLSLSRFSSLKNFLIKVYVGFIKRSQT